MAAPRKENVKEIVLDATAALLKTNTFADLSLAQIAKAAGVSKGTLYYHYKTKGEIFFDLTDRYLNEQWDDFIRWTENKERTRPSAAWSNMSSSETLHLRNCVCICFVKRRRGTRNCDKSL